ncbi:MAG: DUF6868 family protein [Planctomycetota bacterium]
MTVEMWQSLLGWSAAINAGLLTFWFLFFWLGHDLMYRFHGRLFKVSTETFDAIHYAGLAAYKVFIFVLNLVPYLALTITQR